MTTNGPPRPMISRETRLLLATIVISVVALWVLARIRFQGRPVTPDPVPPVLAQLRQRSTFEDLAIAVSELRPRLAASVVPLKRGQHFVLALRIGGDSAVALVDGTDGSVISRDSASGVALLRVPAADVPPWNAWSPRPVDYPRYLIAADVLGEGVSLRPVFVGAFYPIASPIWLESIWMIPPTVALEPGTFVFTTEGALAGLAVDHSGRRAIVPGGAILRIADRLRQAGQRPRGRIGIRVQPLSPAIALATGARAGVVVTWVDPNGPAADLLAATDVVEALDGQEIPDLEHWNARVERLTAGDSVVLRVRSRWSAGGEPGSASESAYRGEGAPGSNYRGAGAPGSSHEVRDVPLTAVPAVTPAAPAGEPRLGLAMRTARGTGAEVVQVQPGSAAARAAIEPGDVITAIGMQKSPTAQQVLRTFAEAPRDRPILVAITRGDAHRVLALEKR